DVPVTLTENVQDVLAAREAPERLTTLVLAAAVIVPPPQEPVRPLGLEITRPEGSVSEKPTPVRVVPVLLFWMVRLRDVEPLSGRLRAPNVLLMTGGETTVSVAVAVLPAPAVASLAVTLLVFAPAVVPCTSTATLQVAPGGRVAPERLTDEDPATAVAVPPHVLLRFEGVATTSPPGRGSVKETLLSVRFWFVLERSMDRPVVLFSGIVVSPT